MYSINFEEKSKIVIVSFTGQLDKNEPMNYIKSLVTIKNLPENLKIMQDFSAATYEMKIDDLDGIASDIKKYLSKYKSISVAAIHNKSTETAFSIVLANLLKSKNLNYQVFNTLEAGREWLIDK